MKKTSLIAALFFTGFIGGIAIHAYWDDIQMKVTSIGDPEGYTEPEEMIEAKMNRVERLDIAENVHKYHDIIELVAFAPGSGWLKLKTRDGISPTINFFKATDKDIRRFNDFAKRIGEPIRISRIGNSLRITAEETENDLVRFAGKKDLKSKRLSGFYHPKPLTRLAIRRDQKGRIFLVKSKKRDQKRHLALRKREKD